MLLNIRFQNRIRLAQKANNIVNPDAMIKFEKYIVGWQWLFCLSRQNSYFHFSH